MVGLDVPMGKPSYVKGIEPIEQPSKAAILAPSSSDKFIGIRDDLLKLTRRSVDSANFCNISLRAINWLSTVGSTINVASAYWTIGKSLDLVGIGKVRIFLEHISFTTD